MTRAEAKEMFRNDKNSYGCYKSVMTKIDKIYNDFEADQKLDYGILDEVIQCSHCKEKFNESELETDYYEEFASSMPIASICPKCKNDVDNGID